MKRIKTIFMVVLIVLATFAIGTAQSLFTKSEQINYINKSTLNTNFEAQITIYVYEGEGCSCKPIPGAYINATGSEGPVFNVTDDEGKCVLNLVIFSEYRVSIEAENFNKVMFNFDIIDDQTFKFHMGEANEISSQNLQQIQQFIFILYQFLKNIQIRNNMIK